MAIAATSPSEHLLVGTLLTLTFVSGLIDAASVLAMGHVFTANMTGNVVFSAFSFAGVTGFSILRAGVALAAALLGGVLAGNLDSRVSWPKRSTWLFVTCLLEAALVATAAFTAWKRSASLKEDVTICTIIFLTGIAMGVRNGTVRRLGVPDLTTTVLTMTVAALAFDSRLAGGTDVRWQIRISSILCMFAGAFFGAILLRHSLALVLSTSALLTLMTALLHVFRSETEHEAKLNQH
jgi:uncharacterized membrane protein YoaK (UPF0700 family)